MISITSKTFEYDPESYSKIHHMMKLSLSLKNLGKTIKGLNKLLQRVEIDFIKYLIDNIEEDSYFIDINKRAQRTSTVHKMVNHFHVQSLHTDYEYIYPISKEERLENLHRYITESIKQYKMNKISLLTDEYKKEQKRTYKKLTVDQKELCEQYYVHKFLMRLSDVSKTDDINDYKQSNFDGSYYKQMNLDQIQLQIDYYEKE